MRYINKILENPYFRLILSSIQSKMEYRGTFIAFLLTILGFYLSQVMVIGIMIYKFKTIKGWTPGELALLYTLLIFSMGCVSTIFSGLIDFSDFIRKGDYDRVLLRPLSTLGQIISMNFDLTGLTHLGLGFIALFVTNQLLEIQWTFLNIFYFIITIIGGTLILGSIRIIIASICFYAISNESLQHLIVFSSREFLLYPLNIYTKSIQIFLTFFFPIAFVNYYPSYYFLSKDLSMIFHPILVYGTLPVGLMLFLISLLIWKMGERFYGSTGS
ncbi:MAG: membrane protein [Leptospiraceae bacterium]|nr:MAG: membrane protein [Leptospiraceae bacterium]